MHAIRIHETGGPEKLRYEDITLPDLKPHEVRVKNAVIGVNFIDIYHRTGLYQAPLPFTPGLEGAGTVAAVGDHVRDLAVGQRVAYCTGAMGAYAHEHILPAQYVVPLPESMPFELAAAIMLQGLTAHYLIHDCFAVKPGTRVLLHAAAGGVGSIVSQWAAAKGATVIGTVGDAEKAKLAMQQGCSHTILYREEDFVARVHDITSGHGVDVVYDSVGASTLMGSLDCLRPRGMLVSFGQSSGKVPPFDPALLAAKGSLFFTRPTLNHYVAARIELLARAQALFAAIASRQIIIKPPTLFALKEAAAAHTALEGRATTGKILLIP